LAYLPQIYIFPCTVGSLLNSADAFLKSVIHQNELASGKSL
jgi:hypothetical protein